MHQRRRVSTVEECDEAVAMQAGMAKRRPISLLRITCPSASVVLNVLAAVRPVTIWMWYRMWFDSFFQTLSVHVMYGISNR